MLLPSPCLADKEGGRGGCPDPAPALPQGELHSPLPTDILFQLYKGGD